jgi:ornithine decarboxylase
MAAHLLRRAPDLGVVPWGVSFHVGSQQRDPAQWDKALADAADLFRDLEAVGVELGMVNLGGGFPVRYRDGVPPPSSYGPAIMDAVRRHFGNRLPFLIAEPGRSLVADAGVIQTEVVLVARKGDGNPRRWVYLDVGRFGGLAETAGDAIRYPIAGHRDGPTGPVIVAGPTCDGADVLYEQAPYELPLDLAIGDRLEIGCAGAYTTTYASTGFNGFAPLEEHYV